MGSRGNARSKTTSTAPVDVFNINQLIITLPQTSLNDILNNIAPSFTATAQTIADGSDHIDPATIRGLGPDHTLVLINGKRRYTTALVNVNGTVGRGSVGTDLNAIPVNAIDKLELLRDGAAAQYGSDAVAGVLNIQLKKNINKGSATLLTGLNPTTYQAFTHTNRGDFINGIDPTYINRSVTDGQKLQANINYGWKLGKVKGSFINFSLFYESRNETIRSGERTGNLDNRRSTDSASNALLTNLGVTRDAFRIRTGQSRTTNIQAVINSEYKLKEDKPTILYYNIIFSKRDGNSAGFYRLPYQSSNIPSIYPKGFLPEINSVIYDNSIAVGLKGKFKNDWKYDISNVYGGNSFDFIIDNSLNVSAWYNNPNSAESQQKKFNAGGFSFTQNTTNLDFTTTFDNNLKTNLAFGLESRIENYSQKAGEATSWGNYTRYTNGQVDIYNGTLNSTTYTLADNSKGYPVGGSQVFAGLTDANASSNNRSSQAVYGDVEISPTNKWLIDGAIRFENYSDFGRNLSYKLATRYTITEGLNFRASFSTGFRSPSLQQKYLAKTSSLVVNGVVNLEATLPNDSRAAQLLGIPSLKPELSSSYSFGLTYKLKQFNITADYFNTLVTDRIILTDAFVGSIAASATDQDKEIYNILQQNNATRAVFMANAIDLKVSGVDLITNYKFIFSNKNSIRLELATTFTNREIVGNVKSSDKLKGKEHIYLSPINKALQVEANPISKGFFLADLKLNKLNIFGKLGYFGSVTHVEAASLSSSFGSGWYYKQEMEAKFVTDLTVGYELSNLLRLSAGVNNLFDVYPDLLIASKGKFFQLDINSANSTYNTVLKTISAKEAGVANNDAITSNNQLNYSRRISQIGLNGRFVFLRLDIRF